MRKGRVVIVKPPRRLSSAVLPPAGRAASRVAAPPILAQVASCEESYRKTARCSPGAATGHRPRTAAVPSDRAKANGGDRAGWMEAGVRLTPLLRVQRKPRPGREIGRAHA